MPKYQEFFYELLAVQQYVNENTETIKTFVGDSTENNRTVSVNQTLRYIQHLGRRKAYTFGSKLYSVYGVLKPVIKNDRRSSTKRTDAIDLNELVATYRAVVMNDRELRQTIGQTISKAR